MMLKIRRIRALLVLIYLLATCSILQGCDRKTNTGKGAIIPMKTYYIGRFSIAVPAVMKLIKQTSEIGYVDIKEVNCPKSMSNKEIRTREWSSFLEEVNRLSPPEGKDKVIIRIRDFDGMGQWAKGALYYDNYLHPRTATWAILLDNVTILLWLKCGPTLINDENETNRVAKNISVTGKSYQLFYYDSKENLPQGDWFYLKYGAVNLPYEEQEESYARFEGHPLDLVLDIKMEMDVGNYREAGGLIEKTQELLAEAALMPGISASKIRLGKRVVAGMKGEESILRMSEAGRKILQFTWEFNGKEDSGEYPTTAIEMESPDGNLDEKIKIWDAVLDSMKPMFVRKN